MVRIGHSPLRHAGAGVLQAPVTRQVEIAVPINVYPVLQRYVDVVPVVPVVGDTAPNVGFDNVGVQGLPSQCELINDIQMENAYVIQKTSIEMGNNTSAIIICMASCILKSSKPNIWTHNQGMHYQCSLVQSSSKTQKIGMS